MNRLYTVLLALAAVALHAGCTHRPSPQEQLQAALVQQYQSVGKLILSETTLQKTVTLQDPRISFYDIGSLRDFTTWLKNQTRTGARVGIYSFQAILVSYTDLTQFSAQDVSYDEEQRTLTLYIAPIQTEIRGRDFDLKTEYEYVAPLREAITPQERAKVKDQAYRVLQEEVLANQQLQTQIRERSLQKLRSWIVQLMVHYELPPQVHIVERGTMLPAPRRQS